MKPLSALIIVLLLLQGCRNDESPIAPSEDGSIIDMLNGIVLISHGNPAATDQGQICIINPDGSDFRELTKKNDSISFVSAAWSPDMERLAVVWVQQTGVSGSAKKVMGVTETRLFSLGLTDANGRIRSVMQKSTTEPSAPIWSPDGAQIVVTSRDANSYPQCFVYDATVGGSRQITHFNLSSGTFASPVVYGWDSPDELVTCVRIYADGTVWFEFWKMDLSGMLVRKLFQEKGQFVSTPDRHAGLTVCNYSRPGGTTGLLAINDLDSTMKSFREELIANESGESYGDPKLSPDGKGVCFTVKTPTLTKVFVRNLATSSEKMIYSAPAVSVCDWR